MPDPAKTAIYSGLCIFRAPGGLCWPLPSLIKPSPTPAIHAPLMHPKPPGALVHAPLRDSANTQITDLASVHINWKKSPRLLAGLKRTPAPLHTIHVPQDIWQPSRSQSGK